MRPWKLGVRAALLFAVSSSLSAVGCAQPGAGDEDLANMSEDVVANVIANVAKVEATRLTFPKSYITTELRKKIAAYQDAIAAGKKQSEIENVILIGDRQKGAVGADGRIKPGLGNPYGYIRRATSVRDSGANTIIETEDATLEEALAELEQEKVIEIGAGPAKAGSASSVKPKVNLQTKLDFTIPIMNVADHDLVRTELSVIQVKTASVQIAATIGLGVDIGLRRLHHAHTTIDADLQSEILVEATLARAYDASPSAEVFSGQWAVGTIGPIPVTLQIKTTIGCDVHAAGRLSISGGMKASVQMSAGVKYDRGAGTSPTYTTPKITPTVIRPTVNASADGSVKCYLRPELGLLLAGMAGPTVTPNLHGSFKASVPPLEASLAAGATVDVGGTLSVLGRDLGRVDKQIFSYEKPLWSY